MRNKDLAKIILIISAISLVLLTIFVNIEVISSRSALAAVTGSKVQSSVSVAQQKICNVSYEAYKLVANFLTYPKTGGNELGGPFSGHPVYQYQYFPLCSKQNNEKRIKYFDYKSNGTFETGSNAFISASSTEGKIFLAKKDFKLRLFPPHFILDSIADVLEGGSEFYISFNRILNNKLISFFSKAKRDLRNLIYLNLEIDSSLQTDAIKVNEMIGKDSVEKNYKKWIKGDGVSHCPKINSDGLTVPACTAANCTVPCPSIDCGGDATSNCDEQWEWDPYICGYKAAVMDYAQYICDKEDSYDCNCKWVPQPDICQWMCIPAPCKQICFPQPLKYVCEKCTSCVAFHNECRTSKCEDRSFNCHVGYAVAWENATSPDSLACATNPGCRASLAAGKIVQGECSSGNYCYDCDTGYSWDGIKCVSSAACINVEGPAEDARQLGDIGGNEVRLAQSFKISSSKLIKAVEIKFGATINSPIPPVTLRIETNSSSNLPSGTALAFQDFTPIQNSWNKITFAPPNIFRLFFIFRMK